MKLFKLIEAADIVNINGSEMTSLDLSEDGSLYQMTSDFDPYFNVNDQEIKELTVEGECDVVDEDGDSVRMQFLIIRPMTFADAEES